MWTAVQLASLCVEWKKYVGTYFLRLWSKIIIIMIFYLAWLILSSAIELRNSQISRCFFILTVCDGGFAPFDFSPYRGGWIKNCVRLDTSFWKSLYNLNNVSIRPADRFIAVHSIWRSIPSHYFVASQDISNKINFLFFFSQNTTVRPDSAIIIRTFD